MALKLLTFDWGQVDISFGILIKAISYNSYLSNGYRLKFLGCATALSMLLFVVRIKVQQLLTLCLSCGQMNHN